MKKNLDTVTLIGIDCANIDRLVLAANICQEHFNFANVKLLTSLPASNHKHIVPIAPLPSIPGYSRFMFEELDRYVDTPHALIIQYDGFILNHEAWTDEFLNYDYIGVPWLVADWSVRDFGFPKEALGTLIVGNGGFCLRSKRLISLCKEFALAKRITEFHPEDTVICVHKRQMFEEAGMRFAPIPLAKQFSFESINDEHKAWNGQFGFHGIRWTDISQWQKAHPEYRVDMEKNTIEKI